ncbi:MAG: hypothetical protein NTY09_13505 [bacterium]|nr:hypothetical protein [bacterium]
MYRQPFTFVFFLPFLYMSIVVLFSFITIINGIFFLDTYLLALIPLLLGFFMLPYFRIYENEESIYFLGIVFPIINYKIFKEEIDGVYHIHSYEEIYKYSIINEFVRLHPKWLARINGLKDEIAIFTGDKVVLFCVGNGREVVENLKLAITPQPSNIGSLDRGQSHGSRNESCQQ